MKLLLPFSKSAIAVAVIATMHGLAAPASAEQADTVSSMYNPTEERASFDLVMKPYPVPVATTTYVDFVFNLPDNLPNLFHVVFGEVIISQPEHLHHFAVFGCPEKFDPSEEGMPMEFKALEDECIIPLGGWAPGRNVFGNVDLDEGILMGRGLGFESIRLNVHYTDGVYSDPSTKTQKMATDGIRVHYTPDFRPYSGIVKPILNVAFGPRQLTVPPGEPRFYVTKTCKVNTRCKDATKEQLDALVNAFGSSMGIEDAGNMLGGDLSCESMKPLCNIGGEFGPYIQRFCPASCGLCEKSNGDNVNPYNPGSYRLTSVQYHAHLLGSEMYTTLLREENENDTDVTVASLRQGEGASSTVTTATDLGSKEFWIFDDQSAVPLDVGTDMDDTTMHGQLIKPGDKIQATCVYNSEYRTKKTLFGWSSYDEMCITNLRVTFETPASLLTTDTDTDSPTIGIDLATELELVTFSCDEDETTDVYTGVLAKGEDARNIWKDHPIEDAEGCTFPGTDLITFSFVLMDDVRNCPANEGADASYICGGLDDPDVLFLAGVTAGNICDGGDFDERDSNDGLTEKECLEGGGEYNSYSCEEVEYFLMTEWMNLGEDVAEYITTNWYQPKCCRSPNREEEIASAAPGSGHGGKVLAVLSGAAVAILAMAWL